MRSRIQFKSGFYDLAAEAMKAKDLLAKSFLAVLWRPSKEWTTTCKFVGRNNKQNLRRRVAQWIKKTFPPEPEALLEKDRFVDPCDPTQLEVSSLILKKIAGNPNITSVYFPAYTDPEMMAYMRDKISIPVKSLDGEESVETDIVDLIVASSAAEVIGNRFSVHSEVVLEMFLLKNNIRPKGISFF